MQASTSSEAWRFTTNLRWDDINTKNFQIINNEFITHHVEELVDPTKCINHAVENKSMD